MPVVIGPHGARGQQWAHTGHVIIGSFVFIGPRGARGLWSLYQSSLAHKGHVANGTSILRALLQSLLPVGAHGREAGARFCCFLRRLCPGRAGTGAATKMAREAPRRPAGPCDLCEPRFPSLFHPEPGRKGWRPQPPRAFLWSAERLSGAEGRREAGNGGKSSQTPVSGGIFAHPAWTAPSSQQHLPVVLALSAYWSGPARGRCPSLVRCIQMAGPAGKGEARRLLSPGICPA